VQQVTVYQQPNQAGGYPGGIMPRIASHMAWAIIMLFFFWPGAIVAIVNASRVNSRLAIGDFYGAQQASHSAKVWCWVSFIVAVVWVAVVIVMYAVVWHATGGLYNY
jgi:hypothetical protein